MQLAALLLASLLVASTALMTLWTLAWTRGLGGLRPTVPEVQILPAPVGGHPSGSGPWFLVVGDSISAGITPSTLGNGPNPSWVGGLAERLAASRHGWRPDDLACPMESTVTYATGCRLAFTNPLLDGRPQRVAALADIASHPGTLRFIVVELGANDLLSMRAAGFVQEADAAVGRLQRIVAELQRAAPRVPLFVANVYDPYAGGEDPHAAQIDEFNLSVAAAADAAGVHLIDFANAMAPGGEATRARMCRLVECEGDGMHPTPRGGSVLAAAAFQAISDAGLLGPSL
jgi:lysophospholipase L1-like esterase